MTAVSDAYRQLVANHELKPDSDQAAAAARLDVLAAELSRPMTKPGLLGRLFGRETSEERPNGKQGV